MKRSNLVTKVSLWEKVKTVDFSEVIAASDLKVGRCRQLIEVWRCVSIEGQGHFFTIYFPGFKLCFTRPRYQVSVYRTIGPLVSIATVQSRFLAHLSQRLTRWAYSIPVKPSSVCVCVCVCVCVSTFSNIYISEASGPITTKFYLKHHWVWGKKALGFGPDRIRTLVSMATDSTHRVIMGKMLWTCYRFHFWSDLHHTYR